MQHLMNQSEDIKLLKNSVSKVEGDVLSLEHMAVEQQKLHDLTVKHLEIFSETFKSLDSKVSSMEKTVLRIETRIEKFIAG